LLSLYVYYFLGSSLEQQWGRFSFTVYYALGILGAILAGFITGVATNTYLNLSLLLAFAQLFPDVEFRIFFLIPVKVKYIGYVSWILYALALFAALINLDWPQAAAILASLLNFFLFFGPDILDNLRQWVKYSGRRRQWRRDVRGNRDRW
jgi:membrane associated rhomboid family serine protease